jgi:SAM-dependent methyltransferase
MTEVPPAKGALHDIDPAKVEAFAMRGVTDLAATVTTFNVALGDRYGLFKDLAAHGACTARHLAQCTGTNERYVLEWARALACAGYLRHDAAHGTFELPPEHAPVLAEEGGAAFLGGFYQTLRGLVRGFPAVEKAFRDGGGVLPEQMGDDVWIGEERANELWHNHLLVQDWIPRLADVQRKLETGANVLDLGCGGGRAIVRLAQAYPRSRFIGMDIDAASIERARDFAKQQGVEDRVRFEVADLVRGLGKRDAYDVVTAFDVLHDVQDPPKLLRDARAALKPDGRLVVMDMNVADRLEDNVGPIGALIYGVSPFYCMGISLARGGQGWGTGGTTPARLREEAVKAGFRDVRRIDLANPMQVLYEVVP